MPDKPIWITEFGYDSSTKTADQNSPDAKWLGVTDEQQAQWLVRSLLVFSAMPVERAYIYFFDDKDKPSFHASSGITRNFQPKPSFHALAHLQRVLGDYRFARLVTNRPGELRIQEYAQGRETNKVLWAVWSQSGENKSWQEKLTQLPGRLVNLEQMPLTSIQDHKPVSRHSGNDAVEIEVSESPTYLTFEK